MKEINSTTNFRVLQWKKLQDKNKRNETRQFMVEGYHLVSEAYKAGQLVEVITTENRCDFDVPAYKVRYDVLKELSSMATPNKIIGICAQKEAGPYGNNVLLVDKIHHPGNLGTIIRSAVAFNVDTIVINESVDVYNQKVVQATQGMLFHINIIKGSLQQFIPELKGNGYQIIGTDVRDGVELEDFVPARKHALIVGNEGEGLDDETLDMCDAKVNIAMNPNCESLNVGVATGIILYKLGNMN
ncbi:MAG: RNA methyltransferase [Erysipelotrichaceae bacterium]|nr:RNA methyltransferase [Erysipelotrichaceae bacterium]